jgi:hypothetical protein
MEDCDSKSARANSSPRPYIEKPLTKIELVEWLNVKALSSSPSTAKKKKFVYDSQNYVYISNNYWKTQVYKALF